MNIDFVFIFVALTSQSLPDYLPYCSVVCWVTARIKPPAQRPERLDRALHYWRADVGGGGEEVNLEIGWIFDLKNSIARIDIAPLIN
jgi:hypothetical protein